WATPTLETCAGVVGALLAGTAVVPVNPKIGPRERDHVLRDNPPGVVGALPDELLPAPPQAVRRITVDLWATEPALPRERGSLRHVGRFSPDALCRELATGATMLFGVPTMYHALAEAAEEDPAAAQAIGGARLLVSGSAPLPVRDFLRIERATGQRIAERYG